MIPNFLKKSVWFYTLRGWVGHQRVRFRTKVLIAVSAALLFITALTTYFSYRVAVVEMTHEFGRKLLAVAATGSMDIDGDAFATIRGPADMETPAYRAIQTHLRRLRQVNSHIRLRYVYTMAPTDKPGIWRYVVDSELENTEGFSKPGATEDFTYDARFLTPLDEPIIEDEVQDYPGWGLLLSASAPIRARDGRPVGILSVDAQADALMAAIDALKQRAAFFAFLALTLAVLISLPVAWQVTRPLAEFMDGVRAVTLGDFTRKVEVPNRDELGDLAAAFNRMTDGLHERELYKRQFERYVSPQVAEKIMANPEKGFWEAERRRVTILFSDIRGFTALAERLPPEEVIRRLNIYLSEMIDIVFEHGGTLDKFIGDAVMATFGAPLSLGDEEERAVRAALAMQWEVQKLRERWAKEGIPDFAVGIAINTGDAVLGNIGSERRLEYGAIGDTVNLAARLEALNKDYKTEILISETTYQAVKKLVEARYIDEVAVRGREKPVKVYELIGLKKPA